MKSVELRDRLKFTRAEWARALNVNERTVVRWEDENKDPGGVAAEVMRAIHEALEDGADPVKARRALLTGIGSMVFAELIRLK